MKEPIVLTTAERMSPLWAKFMAHFEERIEVLRNQLEGAAAIDVANLQARIKEIRALMALDRSPVDND